MKILFALRSKSHLPYLSSVIDAFADDTVEVLFDKGWTKTLDDRWMKRRGSKFVFFLRELRSYANYINRKQSEYYINRWRYYLPFGVRWIVKFEWVKWVLSVIPFDVIESLIPACHEVSGDIKRIDPDVVIATPANHRFSTEIEYIKSAKKLGIPTVIMNLSWDNISTKGTFHVKPDLLMVWNESQKRQAREYHNIQNTQIIGAPFFDKWFDNIVMEGRNDFCKRMGLEACRPYVLYLGSSANIAPDETDIIQEIYDGLNMQMLVRPHPANARHYDKLSGPAIQHHGLAESESEIRDFYSAIVHSEATIGINTSAMIDSIILDKRCITILLDRYDSTQRHAVHFNEIREYVELCRSVQECIERIESKPNAVRSSEDFVWDFIRPKGISFPAGRLFMIEFMIWYSKKEQECHEKRSLNMISYT